MAGAFTNQPRTTPVYGQQQATQLGNGDFSQFNQGMQPGQFGMGGGMGGGMGPGGNIYPLGGGMAHTTIYAVVESGQPKIINPETGEYYPPGYIPTITDPSTWEQWQPGQSWTEVMELSRAETDEGWRQIKEILIRPGEEGAANLTQQFSRDFITAGKKVAGGVAEAVYGKDNQTLKDIQARAEQKGQQAINQAPKIVQEAIKQAPQAVRQVGQTARQVGQAVSQAASQVPGQASRFTNGSGGTPPASSGEMRSALTSVAGDRAVFNRPGARRN